MEPEASTLKRTKIACDECRKHKRKCDGQRPVCWLCQKGRRMCEYTSDPNGRKRKRFGPDYVRELEEQVAALRALVNGNDDGDTLERVTSSEAVLVSGLHTSSLRSSYTNPPPSCNEDLPSSADLLPHAPSLYPQTQVVPDQRSALAMEDLGLMMLRMGIEDGGEPSFTIATANRRTRGSISRQKELQSIVSASDAKLNLQVLQDVELRHHLLYCFCRDFNPFHQVLVPEDIPRLEAGDYTLWTPDEQLRNIAAFAAGALFSDRVNAHEVGQQCAEHAENMILRCLKYDPSDLVVQGLSLLAWRDLSLGNDSMSWNLNCSATGLALRLGLHVTALNKLRDQIAPAALQIRKRRIRTFWNGNIYTRNELHHALATCQLWHLWDSFMDQTYAFDWPRLTPQGKKDLLLRSKNALFSFHQESDPALHGLAPSAIHYQLAFHAAVILIHRPFFSEPICTPTLPIALQASTNAALEICRILRYIKNNFSLVDYPPHVINHIICAAVIHLMNATCGKTSFGKRSANSLKTCIHALLDMGRRWKVRQETAIRFLQELAHRWKVVWALPMQFSAPLTGEKGNSSIVGRTTDTANEAIGTEGSNPRPYQQDDVALGIETYSGISGYFESIVGVSELGWLFNTEDI
ncbi:fungal specific transcription factor domain-containing protein [Phlyctema vagabunda]|uniref:Fungal specific transcription factor domain-containing protein n=1 Tax=Phlyctema vagabunda TaxID=108571 RepID=A0ABR4PF31_9HELO